VREVVAVAAPNLALVKYWGKASVERNLPATPSIGITLKRLWSEVSVAESTSEDRVVVDGERQEISRFLPFLDGLRERGKTACRFSVNGTNNFPGAAGLASSASGFAACAKAGLHLLGLADDERSVSSLARIGSASAARSAFGGICRLDRQAERAEPLYDEAWWPELRLVVVVVSQQKKSVSSRNAMERARETSPYYPAWVESASEISAAAQAALAGRNLEALGRQMQRSYLGMFGTMFSSVPPVVYWLPESLAVIHRCDSLRREGVPAWETMDAGPQVKILTTEEHVRRVRRAVEELGVADRVLETEIGGAPRILRKG
jgi:diphosphomevalonate decarboxylase